MEIRFKLLLVILLAMPEPGFGQQDRASELASVLAAAQQARARNDYATAEDVYKAAVKLHSDMPELWANPGLMQNALSRYPDATESFHRAILLNPALYLPNLFLKLSSQNANSVWTKSLFAESLGGRVAQGGFTTRALLHN